MYKLYKLKERFTDLLICQATMKTLWSPCCQEFFHRKCIQDLAYSSGSYHFRLQKNAVFFPNNFLDLPNKNLFYFFPFVPFWYPSPKHSGPWGRTIPGNNKNILFMYFFLLLFLLFLFQFIDICLLVNIFFSRPFTIYINPKKRCFLITSCFRCPKCRSDTDFRSEMQRLGVNVPVQDASWENSQNFQVKFLSPFVPPPH